MTQLHPKSHPISGVIATWLFVVMVAAFACARCAMHRLSGDRTAPALPLRTAVVGLGEPDLQLARPDRGAHRLLLDGPALGHLDESRKLATEPYRDVLARAEEALAEPIASGYQGFGWADTVADLGLMWHATGDERYAEGALRYLRALLDDRFVVGDAEGGEDVVTHDSGYGIRTFGAYSALAYDWLRDAPGMDAALKRHTLERLAQWIGWYAEAGYLRDRPTANYYWGYLTALSLAGIAASGESSAADGWLRTARDELSTRVLPTFRDELGGGGWPEGFQYGNYTTVEIALVAQAFRTGAGIDVAGKMPWLGETVTHLVHALHPDERSVYDGGTWGEHPAKSSAMALSALSIALEDVDAPRAEEARWMIENALPSMHREQAWVRLLADRPHARQRSPRKAEELSHHAGGEGLTFARSDWSPAAVWVSFQAGPRLAEDHQDADQGHFELFRGSDGLLVDGGDSEGSATINHNTLLVDDGGLILNYPPNQGVWGHEVRTTAYGDDGMVVVAVGDIGDAFAPSCAPDGCTKRAVERLVRTVVYVRPSLLVVEDSIVVTRPDIQVTWAAHTTTAPTLSGAVTSAVVGDSRVDVRTLSPQSGDVSVLREPTASGEGSHRANHTWGPMWRIEIGSPRGSRERGFLHFITADRADRAPPPSRLVEGEGLRGGIGRVDGRTTAVLFAAPSGEGRVALGSGADVVIVAGLTPGDRYRLVVSSSSGCVVTLTRAEGADATQATPGGHLRSTATGCVGR